MNRIFKYYKGRKGITLVWMAFMLAVLLMLAGLAIDIAYMYYVKNQLQVAADAAALAGAARLSGTADDTTQTNARTEALTFAAKNSAAGSPVVLASNGGNTLSVDNDITVGNWNPLLVPKYLADGTRTPINAVEVIARRDETSEASPRRQVRVFLGQIFRIIGADWSFMSARASAIASMPPRANTYISVCIEACTANWPTIQVLDPPRLLYINNPPSNINDFAWTSLLQKPTAPGFNLSDLICKTSPYVEVCNRNIHTKEPDAATLKDFESVFYNSQTPKTECPPPPIMPSGSTCGGGSGWWVIIPVTTVCPPKDSNPDGILVENYALVRIIAVCATGGAGCGDNDKCDSYPDLSVPSGKSNNVIVIDRISCVGCNNLNILGLKPALVN